MIVKQAVAYTSFQVKCLDSGSREHLSYDFLEA